MKRTLASAIVFGAGALFSATLVGCSEESTATKTEKISDPGGSTIKTEKVTVESKGSNPPADSAGETGKTGVAK